MIEAIDIFLKAVGVFFIIYLTFEVFSVVSHYCSPRLF